MDIGKVLGVIGVLVAIIMGALVFSEIHRVTEEAVEGLGTTYNYVTLNSAFSDNTGNMPDNWENLTEPAVSDNVTNAWNTIGYLTVTRDNCADNFENGVWYQSLVVSSIYDEVSTATLSFKWRLIDNENIEAIYIRVYLCDATDNTLIFESDNIENTAAWNTQENSVTSVVDAAGTYTIYLRAEIDPHDSDTPNVEVGWNDVSLSVDTYDESVGEETAEGIGDVGSIIFTILPILVLVSIIFMLMWVFSKRD